MVDKRLDTSRAAEHRLQIRERRDEFEIRPDESKIFDLSQIVGFRPDADFEAGKLRREIVAPRLRIADLFVEIDDEQRHVPSGRLGAGVF